MYSPGDDHRSPTVTETSVKKIFIPSTNINQAGPIGSGVVNQAPTIAPTVLIHSENNQFMTAAKKPLTLHHGPSQSNLRQNVETDIKTNYNEFHTYLQTVTKSQSSPLEYTLNEHSEDTIHQGVSNTSGRILEAQAIPPIPQIVTLQQPPIQVKSMSLQSGASEEKKIITVQSSLVIAKQVKPILESRPEGSRLISGNIFESENQIAASIKGLPPKPVQAKEKPKEVSKNRLTPEEAQKISTNSTPPLTSQAPSQTVFNQLGTQQERYEIQKGAVPINYPIASPLKHFDPQLNPPTYQRQETSTVVNTGQSIQFSQGQESTARFYQSELDNIVQNQKTQNIAHQISQSGPQTQTIQPALFIQRPVEPKPAPIKIEPVLLPALCIPPKPSVQKLEASHYQERKDLNIQKGPTITYSRKDSESEHIKQVSQRSSSSFGPIKTMVSEHQTTKTVVQSEPARTLVTPQFGPERVIYQGDVPIIENKPYIFDEKGNKIYIDPFNLSQYTKIARKAPEGALIHHLPPGNSQSLVSDHTLTVGSPLQSPPLQPSVTKVHQNIQGTVQQKSSIVPGTTAVVTLNGVQTAVRYTQTDDGKIIAIPISNSNPQGYMTESIRQSMNKPAISQKTPIIEQHQHVPSQVKVHTEHPESNPIVIHQEFAPKEKRHRSRRDKKDRSDRHHDHTSETHVMGTKRTEYYPAEIPEGGKVKYVSRGQEAIEEDPLEKDYSYHSYSSRSRSRSRNSVRSKSRKHSKHGHRKDDPNYHALRIEDHPINQDNYYSSTSSHHGGHGYSSHNFYSSQSYGMKPYETRYETFISYNYQPYYMDGSSSHQGGLIKPPTSNYSSTTNKEYSSQPPYRRFFFK